jgi:hypothetical protein
MIDLDNSGEIDYTGTSIILINSEFLVSQYDISSLDNDILEKIFEELDTQKQNVLTPDSLFKFFGSSLLT